MVGLVEESMIHFPINSRIKVYNDYGTVRYVGEVKGYQGQWIGVEWDDPDRGKHNGTVNNVSYFTTEHPLSGSMIRPSKISKFESVVEAIEERYNDNFENTLDETLMQETKEYFQAALFEVVGMDKITKKQSRPEYLTDICISNSAINKAGNLTQLTNLVALDLSSTLLWNWQTIADIVKQLKSLRDLSLAQNRIQLPTDTDIINLEPSFRHLKTINLRHCWLNCWSDVQQVARLWPFIESISLQDNDLCTLQENSCELIFKNLLSLDLQQNKLSDFKEIVKLGSIPTLNKLLLMKNNIETIELPFCEYNEKLSLFPSLIDLNIGQNTILDEMHAFNELDKLPKLTYLSKTPDDQNQNTFDEMFSRCISLVKNIKYINKMEITSNQRRGAEYDLWKKLGLEWLEIKDEEERIKFLRNYRNYMHIINKLGNPELTMVKPIKKLTNLITIKIFDSQTNVEMIKKIPRKITVQTLQGIIIKIFNVNYQSNMPKLYYIDNANINIKVLMDNLSKSLDYYSIQDGDTVMIEW